MEPRVNRLEMPFVAQRERLHATIANRTRRVYDLLSGVYPASTYFFHSKAHKLALEFSGLQDGSKVLEVAVGSGEMFDRLMHANPSGMNCGIDISPRMAARTQKQVRQRFPGRKGHCQAVDCRQLPFSDQSFDHVFCCYLFELLGNDDIVGTLDEIYRVLKPGGRFTTVLIGQNTDFFNKAYLVAASIVPSFWGRQVEQAIPDLLREYNFHLERDVHSRQSFYPSRVLSAVKPSR